MLSNHEMLGFKNDILKTIYDFDILSVFIILIVHNHM